MHAQAGCRRSRRALRAYSRSTGCMRRDTFSTSPRQRRRDVESAIIGIERIMCDARACVHTSVSDPSKHEGDLARLTQEQQWPPANNPVASHIVRCHAATYACSPPPGRRPPLAGTVYREAVTFTSLRPRARDVSGQAAPPAVAA